MDLVRSHRRTADGTELCRINVDTKFQVQLEDGGTSKRYKWSAKHKLMQSYFSNIKIHVFKKFL